MAFSSSSYACLFYHFLKLRSVKLAAVFPSFFLLFFIMSLLFARFMNFFLCFVFFPFFFILKMLLFPNIYKVNRLLLHWNSMCCRRQLVSQSHMLYKQYFVSSHLISIAEICFSSSFFCFVFSIAVKGKYFFYG